MKITIGALIFAAVFVASCGRNGGGSRYEERTGDDYEHDRSEEFQETSTKEDSRSRTGNYHTDPRYKYEYRTGTSGNYRYNYDVNGSDADGNSVEGNVDMQGKYGSGTVVDAEGNEKDVDVEWTGYGELEATDEDGNTYELEAD